MFTNEANALCARNSHRIPLRIELTQIANGPRRDVTDLDDAQQVEIELT